MRQAGAGSDHNLVVAKLTLKLRKNTVGESRKQRFDVSKSKDPEVHNKFFIALRNRFNIPRNEEVMTIGDFNHAVGDIAKETLGYRKTKKTEWITAGI
ncbi:hypothetical protein ElyMa_005967900 [Elysia marginata]|uniref:Endonuclease/exonuclease/phosphatase domain-containing protein n=1 Tax=Elysia marginata TaxID=1093978 RepID=A0AAV4GBJ5_9GAST|nr:hypothetical protein ElyMa_005967900 [Elysia marginata]